LDSSGSRCDHGFFEPQQFTRHFDGVGTGKLPIAQEHINAQVLKPLG
jgi:hypothetical protein